MTPQRARGRRPSGYLVLALLLIAAATAGLFLLPLQELRLASLVALLPAGFALIQWHRSARREQRRRLILSRLARLPDDFTLLHDLNIKAPWGNTQVDYVILSRFGIVVAGVGPNAGWITGQVEALRSVLFGAGLKFPAALFRPLVLIPPGLRSPGSINVQGVAIIPVGRVTLEHIAPSDRPVLSQEEIERITKALTGQTAGSGARRIL